MFGGQDNKGTCKVAIVNESAAAALFDDHNAVGHVIEDAAGQRVEIIGVVATRRAERKARRNDEATIYSTRLASVGCLFGLAGALLLTTWLSSVTGYDGSQKGRVWLVGPAVLAVGAVVASLLPARRILRVDPLTAMHME
jgi:hypothetical protein